MSSLTTGKELFMQAQVGPVSPWSSCTGTHRKDKCQHPGLWKWLRVIPILAPGQLLQVLGNTFCPKHESV